MAGKEPRAKVVIEADGNDVVKEAQKVARTVKGLGNDVKDSFREGMDRSGEMVNDLNERLGQLWGTVMNPSVLAAGGFLMAGKALWDFGNAAKETSKEFESAMADVATLVDTNIVNIEELGDQVTRLAVRLGRDPKMVAEALYELISAGVDATDAMDELETSVKAAIGGRTDAKTAVDGITTLLNSYGEAAGDAAHVSDLMFQTVNKGKIRFEELAQYIGLVASVAKSAGVPIEDLMAAIATSTAGGIRPSSAMEGLRSAISNIIKPSEQARTTARLLGLQFNAQALKAKGLAGFLADVRKATKGNTETMAQLFGDVSGLNVVLALTGEQANMFADNLAIMDEATGATEQAFQKQKQTMAELEQGTESLWAAIKKTFGDTLNDHIKPFHQYIQQNTPTILSLTESTAKHLGDMLSNPTEALPPPVAAIAELISSLGELQGAVDKVKEGDGAGALAKVKSALEELDSAASRLTLVGTLKNILDQELPNWRQGVANWFTNLPGNLQEKVTGVGTWINTEVPKWKSGFIKWTDAALEHAQTWFTGLGPSLFNPYSTAASWFDTNIPKWGTAFGKWLGNAEVETANWFLGLGEKMATPVATAAGWFSVKIPEWKSAFVTWHTNSLNATLDFFKNLPGNVDQAITTVGNTFTRTIPEKWNAFNKWLEAFDTDMEIFFIGLPSRTTQWLQDVVDEIPSLTDAFKAKGRQLAQSIWDGMRASIEGQLAGLRERASGIVDTVKEAFKRGQEAASGGSASGGAGIGGTAAGASIGLPGHSEGGIFNNPHIAWVAEGGETEAIVPKSKAASYLPTLLEWAGIKALDFLPSFPDWAGITRGAGMAMAAAGGGSMAMAGPSLSLGSLTVVVHAPPGTTNPQGFGEAAGDALYSRLERLIKLP